MANAIATTSARLKDGSVVSYRDADPSHVRQGRFAAILAGDPLHFAVITDDGTVFAVDLRTGELAANGTAFSPVLPPTPLRLIYYKHMTGTSGGGGTRMEYFVVGWQTTLPGGRNVKVGLKVFPDQHEWQVTEDI